MKEQQSVERVTLFCVLASSCCVPLDCIMSEDQTVIPDSLMVH